VRGGALPPAQLEDERRKPRASENNSLAAEARASLAAMSAAERERLTKFVGMLASEHDGEILNAARAASALLRSKKLTWADALEFGLARTRPE
jgi:hypothetical protein